MNSSKTPSNQNTPKLPQTAITYLKKNISGTPDDINKAWNNLNLGNTKAESLTKDQLRLLQEEVEAIVTKAAEKTLDEHNQDIRTGFRYS